ncbi:phage integrase central domain-containing protein [Cryptosporangium sp. NPDC051539]|uniref:phage integrase central domain-containing protein n=1 Tax=Cryptosporangium sp. NPDC051539 TaxID=3363962 RepID=UPI0037AFF215
MTNSSPRHPNSAPAPPGPSSNGSITGSAPAPPSGPTTARSYHSHIELYLVPTLGHYKLGQVTARQLTAAFAELAQRTNRYGQPLAGSTLHRVRATLRAAFNSAIREGMITDNPARRIELPPARRPHAVVWTDTRVQHWHRTHERDSVSVWTVDQLAVFLQRAQRDRLHALFHLSLSAASGGAKPWACGGVTSTSTRGRS